MASNRIELMSDKEISKSYEKLEIMLSSQKARDCLRNLETELAFDIELHLQPLRNDLSECLHLIADLTRERGTASRELQNAIPVLSDYLDPGTKFAKESAALEKQIADKKKKHPDYILAFKLQMLVKKLEESLQSSSPDSLDFYDIQDKLNQAKATLADHMQSKIRIAQRALAPDMLELAQWQLELARHREKALRLKKELLDSGRKHSENALKRVAQIFKDAEPEITNTILQQTRSVIYTGDLPSSPGRKEIPPNLAEYRKEIQALGERLISFDQKLQTCMSQLHKLMEFEEAIFNTYGEQLREKGFHFEKQVKIEKSVSGLGPKKQPVSRMVSRQSPRDL
ncbi:MAG: hypothetical protein AB1656_12035 [Candidatus Omnitrophota bacterium]